MIKVECGKYYTNKSQKYLAPGMKLYGEEFATKISSLATLACAIGHNKLDTDNNIYFVFDIYGTMKYDRYQNATESKLKFLHIISWFRQQDYYVKDYPYDSSRNGHKHIVVFKHPKNISKFIEGKYSEIYEELEINKCFKKFSNEKSINPIYQILKKDNSFLEQYLKNLNSEFGTTLVLNDIRHHSEYDIKPNLKYELL